MYLAIGSFCAGILVDCFVTTWSYSEIFLEIERIANLTKFFLDEVNKKL